MSNNMDDLKKVELDILKQFIKVCKKLNLSYYLLGGTLIGAVRHKGFIPWDDDIDVCMRRKDYEIFIREGQKYLNNNYFIQTYETDQGYLNNFAKIRNSNTTFIESSVKNINMNHGIYIDIFPLDNLYNYNKLKEKLIHYHLYKEYYLEHGKTIQKIIVRVANFLYNNKTKVQLCKKLDNMYTKMNDKKLEKIVNYCGAWGVQRESHYVEDFEKLVDVKFEDVYVKAPIGYKRVLTDTYGDYMKLPPEEKRVAHHYSEIIDVNKSYKEYFKEEK